MFSSKFSLSQPFRGMTAHSAAGRIRLFGALTVFTLALLALAAGLLWLPRAEHAQAQDGSPAAITSGPVITSSPASGDAYARGEAIAVALTFSEAVTVAGEPRIRLTIGERKRWARHSGADGATLTFAYTVKGNDQDADGVSIGKNALKLNKGSIADGDGNAASLSHPALADQAGHKVNVSPEEAPAEPEPTPTPTPKPEPANSEPQFDDGDSATRSVDEDAAVGSNVGGAIAATDADDDTLTYALSGSDTFTIGASTGQIGVNGALDYETQASYALTVTVSDGKNAAGEADSSVDDTIAVTVTVVNVDEAAPPQVTAGPVITSSPASGDAYGKDEAIVVAVTFSEAVTVTGEPRIRLTIGERKRWARHSGANGATLTFAYKVKGSDRDGDGISIGANQLRLNKGSIADGDGNAAVLSHPALTDQAGHQVDGSQEPPADGQQQRQASNSAPQFAAGSATTLTVAEDAAVGSNVGDAIAATDADNDALTYALRGSDAFTIDASTGQIGVNGALNYETQSSYALTVTVSDGKNAAGDADAGVDATIAVTVNVGNVDEAGVVFLEYETYPLEVGSKTRAVLLDPDGVVGAVAWTWQRSADATTWETVAGATGETYTATADDAGSYLRATAAYADGHGPGKTARDALSEPVAAIITAEEPRTEGQLRLTGSIVSGYAKTNVADVATGNIGSGVRFTACVGQDCTPTKANWVAAGVKITSVGITVSNTGQVDYDGTNIDGPVIKVAYWLSTSTSNTPIRTATINVVPLPAPAKPAGFIARPDKGKVELAWTVPGYDTASSITKYQYQQKEGSGAYGKWLDISGSGATTTAHTVTGLKNETAYGFRIRAVNGNGNGAQSDEATATPQVNIIWSATLTATQSGSYRGCNDNTPSKACSDSTVLTDKDFTHSGTTYVVKQLELVFSGSTVGELQFSLDKAFSQGARNSLTLHVGASQFALSDADYSSSYIVDGDAATISRTGLTWADGQKVSVWLVQGPPAKPAGFIARPDKGKVELAWTDPSDSGITKYQYQQKEGAGAYGKWLDISGSGATTTAHTVTGLKNGTAYGFRIRAVNAAGNGAESDAATATPQVNIIWSATLTVDKDEKYHGCDNEVETTDDCSDADVLTVDGFTYGGVTYTVNWLHWDNTNDSLTLKIAGVQAGVKAALGSLTLNLDGVDLAVSDGSERGLDGIDTQDQIFWSFDLDWTDGQKVSVWLTRPFTAAELDYRVTEVTCDAPGNKGTRCYVPYNWSAIPRDADGEPVVPSGKSFRLMFMTSANTAATSTTLGAYNTFVQGKANGVDVLKPLKDHFRALVSSAATSAVVNTKTGSGDLGRNSPIYMMNNVKVADGYADFYDGSWDYNSISGQWPSLEDGRSMVSPGWRIWTGSKPDGTGQSGYHVGEANVMYGDPNVSGRELGATTAVTSGSGTNVAAKATTLPLYGISPVLTVGEPPPDSTEDPVWWATLTVDKDGAYYGCDSSDPAQDSCSDRRVLEYDDRFTYVGVSYVVAFFDYEVDYFYWNSSENEIELVFSTHIGSEVKAALSSLTLNVMDANGYTLAVRDAEAADGLTWDFDPRKDWTEGQKVFLSLTVNGRQPAPPALTGLKAVSQNGAVWLTWDEADNVESPTGKQQVRYRPRESGSWGAWTAWKDVKWFSHEGYELVGLASTTVYGLTNGTRYQFEVRPVNAGGKGRSARVEAAPKAKPAAPTGLVANSADGSVVLHWDYANNDDITEYQYRWRLAGADGGDWQPIPQGESDPSELTAHTVSGLPGGFNIDFQVRARSNNGWSRPSAASNAVKPEAPPAAPKAVTVPQSWDGIPTEDDGTTSAVKPGESFRLLFVTSAKTAATATNISHYNEFVQNLVDKNNLFKSFKDQFRAVISTAEVSARENIGADLDGNKVPVYWAATRGSDGSGWRKSQLVVGRDLFEDLWPDIEYANPYNETGASFTYDGNEPYLVWTGSLWDGRSWRLPYHNPRYRYYAGAAGVMAGNLNSEKAQISWYDPAKPRTEHPVNTTELPLYGISPVITVSEDEIWAATLTVDFVDGEAGCKTSQQSGMESCSDSTVLTEDTFTYEGSTYTIVWIVRANNGRLGLEFDSLLGPEAKTALGALTLNMDGQKFAISSAGTKGGLLSWAFPTSWTDGQKVSLSISRTQKPGKPTGLAAVGGGTRAALSWDLQDTAITKRQYRQKEGSGAWSAWTDIPNSAPGQANATSYTVTGLNGGATYAFQLRAVNGAGGGPESDEATVTLPLVVWAATLTVDVLPGTPNRYGCSNNSGLDNCSSATVLTDDDFTYAGATYTVDEIFLIGGGSLSLGLNGITGAEAKAALGALTLWVDGRKLAVKDFTAAQNGIFRSASLSWTDGQKVSLELTR